MRLVIVTITALAIAGCARDASRDETVTLISPDMAYTVAFDPYDPNPVTRNGATLMLPPEGTVPVGGSFFPYGPGPKEAARAGRELENPIDDSKENLKRGAHIFNTYCAVCHGREGKGDGPIIGRFPNPPTLHAERALTITDGEMYHIITTGQGIMAAYNVQVRPDDRWRAIHHIRVLQGAK
jgi:mono/diheme cytochrome c family protein